MQGNRRLLRTYDGEVVNCGARYFSVSAPCVWNKMSDYICEIRRFALVS